MASSDFNLHESYSSFGQATTVTLGTTYTADKDGYLYAQIGSTSSTDTALVRVTLNGVVMTNLRASSLNTQGVAIYVRKGMSYKVEGVGSDASALGTFRPLSN